MTATDPSQDVDVEVDASGLLCPMPLLKAKKALNGMAVGESLRLVSTDPGSERDFEVFCRQSGHALLSSARDGDRFIYLLRKA
ncbi:MAG: sulfurtransferase TusA family protein [Pseudomonadales bacterium]|nr:sulfurtransferase TusA family protein [Pseudomonadales bacterium]